MRGNDSAPNILVTAPQDERGTASGPAAATAMPDDGAGNSKLGSAPDDAVAGDRSRRPTPEPRQSIKPSQGDPALHSIGASEPTGFPNDWRNEMAAGDRTFLRMLDRFETPVALAKAYKELTAKLSSGELRAMKPPGHNATPQELAAWRVEHGLPENPAAYVAGLTLADGTVPGEADQPLLANFAELASKGNWTGAQYNEAVGWYFAMQDRLAAQRQQADAEFKAQASADLMREWGTDYVRNGNAVTQFLDRNFPRQLRTDALNARLPDGRILANDPAFNKAILELAKLVDPAGAMLPNAAGGALSNVESRIAEIETRYMRATPGSDAWKSYWSGDPGARMQQEYRGLVASREQVRRKAGG